MWKTFVIYSLVGSCQLYDLTWKLFVQYVNWAGLSKPDEFFTNSTTKQMYKDHMSDIVNRRNALTNRLYKEEPAIFAWCGPTWS
jgi:hypothetical protein